MRLVGESCTDMDKTAVDCHDRSGFVLRFAIPIQRRAAPNYSGMLLPVYRIAPTARAGISFAGPPPRSSDNGVSLAHEGVKKKRKKPNIGRGSKKRAKGKKEKRKKKKQHFEDTAAM